MNWISVVENPPEIGEYVIGCGFEDERDKEYTPMIGRVEKSIHHDGKFSLSHLTQCGGCSDEIVILTHWMPIPELPSFKNL